ncbi:PaaI family thioesterase [Halosimplex halophilum]|uniref:PaaI family thioesterase n=1 Tax=Halosimplex halophilum TaxID=2559572 RepID=UPI00107F2CCC|nr:PaaI family thioesterase [Halosimplex halophilum]
MDAESFFEEMPFADLLGIELTEIDEGHAEGRLPMREELSWHSERVLAHGGVTYTLADTVGGAALVSLVDRPVPTVDMRMDYLEAGTGDLTAEADVVRNGGDVGVVDVDVYAEGGDGDGDAHLASARGVYKTGEPE